MEELVDPEYQKLCDAEKLARKAITQYNFDGFFASVRMCINFCGPEEDVFDGESELYQPCNNFDKETPCMRSDCPYYLRYLAYIKAKAARNRYLVKNNKRIKSVYKQF